MKKSIILYFVIPIATITILLVSCSNDNVTALPSDELDYIPTFVKHTLDTVRLIHGTVDWCDYDSDGDFDIIISGASSDTNLFTEIYTNVGDFNFEKTFHSDSGITDGLILFSDLDKDGDTDIVIMKKDSLAHDSYVIYNNSRRFLNLESLIKSYSKKNMNKGRNLDEVSFKKYVDLNNDGNNDLIEYGLLTAHPFDSSETKPCYNYYIKYYQYFNGGLAEVNTTFSKSLYHKYNIKDITPPIIAIADIDQDGDMDILCYTLYSYSYWAIDITTGKSVLMYKMVSEIEVFENRLD